METSGVLVLGLTEHSHRELSKQFEQGLVQKEYVALIDGIVEKATGQSAPQNGATSGQMELYFRVDLDNRPHQMWDSENGKKAITMWKKISTQNYKNPLGQNKKVTRISFVPITGRTHQLRLAAADIHGLAMPIIGDTLYGNCLPGERLMLHARYLSFIHPVTNEKMEFICEPEF
jgi:tRNA pseudouridine32 synthase/23S rRNA pseudouridine746 synthase